MHARARARVRVHRTPPQAAAENTKTTNRGVVQEERGSAGPAEGLCPGRRPAEHPRATVVVVRVFASHLRSARVCDVQFRHPRLVGVGRQQCGVGREGFFVAALSPRTVPLLINHGAHVRLLHLKMKSGLRARQVLAALLLALKLEAACVACSW